MPHPERSAYGSSNNRPKDDWEVSSNLRNDDLRRKSPMKDACERLAATSEERDAKYDGIAAFSDTIRKYTYPASSKPTGIDKYDMKADANLWL